MEVKKRATSLRHQRSNCAVACTLDLIGDKWTLLIIRDMFFGKNRYKDFQDSAEQIPTNILTNRLRKLEKARLVSREPYQENPVRYAYKLTAAGKTLGPVLHAMVNWAGDNLPGVRRPKPTGVL